MKKPIAIAALITIAFLSACATPPTDEMNKAHDAVIRAENDPDAVSYAGNTLIRARDSLNRMQAEADAKRYDSAKNLANEAVNLAERAIADGRTGAARAKEDAANLLNSLNGPLEETAKSLDTARDSRMLLDYDALSGDLDQARAGYDEGWKSYRENSFQDATVKAQAARSILSGINTKITEAAQDSLRKK